MIVAAASMLATLGANIYNRERFNLTSTLHQFIIYQSYSGNRGH